MVVRRFRTRNIVEDFIATVEREMTLQGINMSDLARRAGVARPYLHRILNGEQQPSLEWAEKVATALGLTISFQPLKNNG